MPNDTYYTVEEDEDGNILITQTMFKKTQNHF